MFHKSNYGLFGSHLPCDIDGYVPEADDAVDDFTLDHGSAESDPGYAEWWEEEGFPAWRDEAIAATARASDALTKWQRQSA
jgi:hypothetical protein